MNVCVFFFLINVVGLQFIENNFGHLKPQKVASTILAIVQMVD